MRFAPSMRYYTVKSHDISITNDEWGNIYIMDFLSENLPKDFIDVEETIQKIGVNLSRSNPSGTLSAVRLVMKYMIL